MGERENKLPNFIAAVQSRSRKTIANWRSALQQAENVENPRRNALLTIYKEIVDDAHLSSAIQKRVLAVTGAPFYINDKSSNNDAEKLKEIKKIWFHDVVKYSMDSIFYGHSLIQLSVNDLRIFESELVNRRHVRPETGLFVIKENDDKGVLYREDPAVTPWLIEVGQKENLGLLNKCVPHVLIKRFAQSAWSEYCEIFGMPLRVVKTNTKDTQSLNRLESTLIDMATAAYAIIDDNESIEFIEGMASKGEVYERLMMFCNSEISKLINGAVIGEATQGGSRSKEEVGADIASMITVADMQFIESLVNDQLFPTINSLGFPIEGYVFEFEQAKDIAALWKMTNEALAHYEIDGEWIKETFGIPVGQRVSPASPSAPNSTATAESSNDFFD